MFQIQFAVQARVHPGQKVCVVGNLPCLGEWNPSRALVLDNYDENEWESPSCIEVPDDFRFEFKIIKIDASGAVQWEELPNNSNRKFKAKHHSQLSLKWSNPVGKLTNMAKSSYHVKGLPGIIIKNVKETGLLRKKTFDPDRLAQNDESESESEDDPFSDVVTRKQSADIRSLMDEEDIEEIYYKTSELEIASSKRRKTKIYLICYSFEGKESFCEKILEEIKELQDNEEIYFKWLFFSDLSSPLNSFKSKKSSFQQISCQKLTAETIELQQFNTSNTHFVFIDVKSTMFVNSSGVSCCLYLPSSEYGDLVEGIEELQEYRFVCFDSVEKNKELFEFIKEKKSSEAENFKNVCFEKTIQRVSLEKIIEELHYERVSEKNLNTVLTFSKEQASKCILEKNSILLIDSHLYSEDRPFFEALVDAQEEKRTVIIIHQKSHLPEWMEPYKLRRNIFVVFDALRKFYYLENIYDPLKKHEEVMQILLMKLRILADCNKCTFAEKENSVIIRSQEGLTERLGRDIKIILKDLDYFRVSVRSSRIKVSWNLCHEMRLIKTICKLKYIEEGNLGNFYMVSEAEDFCNLIDEIRVLIKFTAPCLEHGLATKLWHYGYGRKANDKYNIEPEFIAS